MGNKAYWRQQVGIRANDAELAASATPRGRELGSTTLPELLVKAELMKRGIWHREQVELGFLRIDFVAQVGENELHAFPVNGDYWHKDSVGKDQGKAQMLIGEMIDGMRITKVTPIWESDIIKSPDYVISEALAGRGLKEW